MFWTKKAVFFCLILNKPAKNFDFVNQQHNLTRS